MASDCLVKTNGQRLVGQNMAKLWPKIGQVKTWLEIGQAKTWPKIKWFKS
jgi:hypothetical protein